MSVCTRCIQDKSVPGINFDKDGVCNFCHLHDELCKEYPNDDRGKYFLKKFFTKNIDFSKSPNCVVGISGGRDSTYLLWLAVKEWGLKPIAVHFNDGFDNPIAGENMVKACKKLDVQLLTVTSHWKEAKDLKIDFLKASTPDLNLGTDIGIASSLYGAATKHNLNLILIGQSFRTEGVKPLPWSYFDGDYLRHVHSIFGSVPLKKWTPSQPGFNLGIKELAYYSLYKKIRVLTPLYYHPYIRTQAEEIISSELGWVYPGAHYFDDLYHSLIKYVHRVKFGIDLNMNSDSALVRSGQMERSTALKRAQGIYQIEDPEIIRLCLKRLQLDRSEFEDFMSIPPKTFQDYPTSYPWIKRLRLPISALTKLNLLPKVAYKKYFEFGI